MKHLWKNISKRRGKTGKISCLKKENVFLVRSYDLLKKAMGWHQNPQLDIQQLSDFNFVGDLNERRIRDAEVIAGTCCNANPSIILEIGTAEGKTTTLMATNAPNAKVYTVNIPPEEITQGGTMTTRGFTRDEIGRDFRERGLNTIEQIYANTLEWEPDFGPIDVAFIDGCHDADFVYQDTKKILAKCRPGSLILWHDFNPDLARHFDWIDEVCDGVGRLQADGLINGPILHLQDSWVGLYVVEKGKGESP